MNKFFTVSKINNNSTLIAQNEKQNKKIYINESKISHNNDNQYIDRINEMKRGEYKSLKSEENLIPWIRPKEKEAYNILISGQSGSGKTTMATKILNMYMNTIKEDDRREIFLCSPTSGREGDAMYNFVKKEKIRMLPITDEFFNKENTITLEELKDTVIIFDDIEGVQKKVHRDAIYQLIHSILTNGRRDNIKCIIISHNIRTGDRIYRTILFETQLTIFCGIQNKKHLASYLNDYIGVSSNDIIKEAIELKDQNRYLVISKLDRYISTENYFKII